ncbi:MAG: PocR ligand-binding domain-containing protein [Spirochaetaceae bacterium]|jgi:AraC-like DNA-binding protein|nr:PocR ligand-binding domain-containing protein [Spirochaetaceae bacterium]
MANKMNLFFDEEVQRLIDSFAYCFRVKITVFSKDIEELIVGLQNPGSQYCQLIQKGLRYRYRCCRQDKLMCSHCGTKNKLTIYQCHAGCSEAVLPMEVDGALIGYAMLGQFRTNTEVPKDIMQEWKKRGLDTEELRSAYDRQPFFNGETVKNMLNLFSMLIAFVITRDYVRVRRPTLAENVLLWINQHIAEQIELDDAADDLNRSRSAVSHAVKKQLGMSFKQLCTIMKIQKFESIITAEPDISIKDAAARVGYEDPLYFSRIYRKMRLSSPSTYMKSMRERIIEESSIPQEAGLFLRDA